MDDFIDWYEEMTHQEFSENYEDEMLFSFMKEYEFLLEQSQLDEQQIKRLKEIQNIIYDE